MFSIEQSPFLQALGHAIGSSLWQVAALWLAYAAISNIGKWSANRKYQLAAGASLTGFACFVATFIQAYVTTPVQQPLTVTYSEVATDTGDSLPDQLVFVYHSVLQSLKSLSPYISCAYLLMFVLLCIRLRNGFKQVKFFATQGLEKSGVEWRLFVKQHAAALGITRNVKVFASHHVQSPLTLGFWKPIILMPVASLNHLTIAQVESILLHELAHIRRHDYLVNIFLQIAEISLFFNPFMRLLLKQVKQERENSCDDYVLQFEYSPKDYAKALLAIEHSNNTALLALAAKGDQSFQLLNRVKRMVAPQPKAFNYRQQLGLLLLFTVLMLGFTVIVPRPKKASYKSDKLATAIAKQINPGKMIEAPVLVERAPITVEAPPPPERGVDFVKKFTNHRDEYIAEQAIDIKDWEAVGKEMEIQEKDWEAMGNELKEKMQPLTDKINEWANNFSEAADNHFTSEHLTALANLKELKNLPVEGITEISEEYRKKMMSKLNHLFKAIPSVNRVFSVKALPATRAWQATGNARAQAIVRERLTVTGRADFVRQQADKNNLAYNEEVQRVYKSKMVEIQVLQQQAAAMQRKALANADRLHLGLLTDDRDTCITVDAEGTWAKLQPRKPAGFNWQFKTNGSFSIPQEIRMDGKHPGKCVITVTENKVKIAAADGSVEPVNFNTNGQNIDIRHETQINNGKEEKVVVISISGTK